MSLHGDASDVPKYGSIQTLQDGSASPADNVLSRSATYTNGTRPHRGVNREHPISRSLDIDSDVETIRRRQTERKRSLKKKQQLLRVSSSSYIPVPITDDDFTIVRRNRRRTVREQSMIGRSVSLEPSIGVPTPTGEFPPTTGGDFEHISEEDIDKELEEFTDPNIDGGWAWVVMIGSFFLIFIVDGIAFSFGVFLDVLVKEFGEDRTKTSLVGSVLSGLYLGAGPLASALAEKFGYRVVGLSGAVLTSVAFLASSWSPNLTTMIILYGAVGGLGFCFMFLTSMVTTSLYFEKKRPLAVGFASCGSGIGIFVFPLIMEKLFNILSWQNCIRIQAGFVLACSLSALAFRPLKKRTEMEADNRTFKDHLKGLIDFSLFKKPIFLILMVMAVLATMGISTPFIYIKDMSEQDKGLPEGQSTWLISMMGITNTVGRLLVGAIVYKFPVNPLLILSGGCVIGGILTMLSVFYNTFAMLAVYACLFGNVYALDAALSTEILARTLGKESLSGSFGLVCLVRGVAFAAGAPISGSLYDKTGNYEATFYFAGAAVIATGLLSIFCFVISRIMKRKAAYAEAIEEPSPIVNGTVDRSSLIDDRNASEA